MAIGASLSLEDTIGRTIGAIYDAAVTPERWPDALRRVREAFGTASTAYVMHNADRSRIVRFAAEHDPDGQRMNVETLLRGSLVYTRGSKGHAGQIIRTSELVPDRIFQRSRMYQEYWRPRDLSHALRMTVAIHGGTHHAVNLIRPKLGARFEERDMALARLLMPQLQRAVEVRRRLSEIDVLAGAALAALDLLRHAILLLDQNGRVLHANASGEALLRQADALGAHEGQLFARTRAATSQLHAVVGRAAGRAGAGPGPVGQGAVGQGAVGQGGAVRLPRVAGGPLALLAIPFRQETIWSLSRRPAVLVCVTDPDAAFPLPARQLTELFGLTAAEGALAADLLAGKEPREIADASGRSINTVRTHLAKLMAKTDVNRQSDLMRLLARLPPLGGGDSG
jgi:DNA-binding CsgD family transcriptional regulator/PAS domain-containing protein